MFHWNIAWVKKYAMEIHVPREHCVGGKQILKSKFNRNNAWVEKTNIEMYVPLEHLVGRKNKY
jgi:hypothetical protein